MEERYYFVFLSYIIKQQVNYKLVYDFILFVLFTHI